MSSKLEQELWAAGASDAEAAQLSATAATLRQLKGFKHLPDERQAAGNRSHLFFKLFAGGLTGVVLGAMLILVAQPVLPTNWLYPVQQFSDSIAVRVRPQYRATIMMKRAQQVDALVASHASSKEIIATLADYSNQAKAYETMPHANYAAFEFCKIDLEQAEASAAPPVRQAIQTSLQALQTA
jgi:hypothetical protein